MARTANPAKKLANAIMQLQVERRTHMAAVERIDAIFQQCGIQAEGAKRVGRPPGVKSVGRPAGKRTRRSFPKSGLQSILEFVKTRGAKGATTSEINNHWREEGRAGSAYVTIGQLVEQRELKKTKLKGERGSRYSA